MVWVWTIFNAEFVANIAPEGCLQYHQGVSGILRSYNFDFTGGQQLSNQDFSACIRMERNFCGIRYTACTDNRKQSKIYAVVK